MGGGRPFIDVLFDKLGQPAAVVSRPLSRQEVGHYPPPSVLYFDPRFDFCEPRLPAESSFAHVRPPWTGVAPTPRPRPDRIQHRLSGHGRHALNEIVALGAALDESCSEDELRRAFKLLARRYHPDCRPLAGEAEKARLSRLFVSLHRAYKVLLRATKERDCCAA
jgi:hypothetical protein